MREELDRILAKESLNDADINTLAKNIGLLTQEEKVRLGFISAPVDVKSSEVDEKVSSPEVVVPEVAESKSVARRKAVSKKKK